MQIKTLTADNKEQDDGGSLLADNGDKDHGADVKDKEEVHVATNDGDRGDCNAEAVTASHAIGFLHSNCGRRVGTMWQRNKSNNYCIKKL